MRSLLSEANSLRIDGRRFLSRIVFGHFYMNCRHSKPFEIEEKRLYFNLYDFFTCRGTKGGVCYASQIVTRGFSLGEAGLGLAQPKERVKSVL